MYYSMTPFGRRNDSLSNLFDQMERTFWRDTGTAYASFPTDIRDEGNQFVLKADLPGFRKEEIEVQLDNGVLTITAQHKEGETEREGQGSCLCRERHDGNCRRTFSVSGIDERAIRAAYENGVLTLTLPKETPVVPEARRINIL
ncbi:MAG TPA: Hsp20/alpha crystallin family protein [Candidatus Onthomonas avicola]|nr:Hsp20/alpha crystallin family protein [Candidatus Onthomonas avicola]